MTDNHIASLLASRKALGGTTRKSWADHAGIPSGVLGETHNNVEITEANRASFYYTAQEDVERLRINLHENFRRNKINAVLFGVVGKGGTMYAIFRTKKQWGGR